MTVGGVFRSPDNQQVWLDHPDWPIGHLVRFCIYPAHLDEPHVHRFEGPGQLRDTHLLDLPQDADLEHPGFLLTEVVVPMLKIRGLVYEGRLE